MRFKQTVQILLILCAANGFLYADDGSDSKNCTAVGCHNTVIDQRVIHDPVEDGCDFCHESSGKRHPQSSGNEFSLTDVLPELCEACHDTYDKENIHEPVEEGDCLICHSPHSSPNLMLLKSDTEQKLCEECHDSEMWNKTNLHAPLKDGKCTACHNPHQSDTSSLLQVNPPQLCFECHKQQHEEESFETVHPPFEEGCLDCHLAHSSDHKQLLKTEFPNLCFDCHDDFPDNIQKKHSVHKSVTDKTACKHCHSAHASHNESLLLSAEPDICFNCHGNAISDRKRKTENIEKKIQTSLIIHQPVEDGDCTGCHNAHFSDHYSLLSGNFPEYKYTPGVVDSFALCFDCHDSELLTEALSTSVTDFRNGNRNLHYLHINRKKGLSCTDCHDIHAANGLHLVVSRVNFGSWKMPINYLSTQQGGSCLPGCHIKKSYRR